MSNDDKWMHKASLIAEGIDISFRARIASIIVYKNRIISVGWNKKKTHPLAMKYSKHPDAIWIHAELDAITYAAREHDAWVLKKSTLYTCRVRWVDDKMKSMEWALSRPCSGCASAIAAFGIGRICYSTGPENEFEVVES